MAVKTRAQLQALARATGADWIDLTDSLPFTADSPTFAGLTVLSGLILGVATVTMGGPRTLTSASKTYQSLATGGVDRELNLPVGISGLSFVIHHKGPANTIIVKDSSGATVSTLTNGQSVVVVYDDVVAAWQVF